MGYGEVLEEFKRASYCMVLVGERIGMKIVETCQKTLGLGRREEFLEIYQDELRLVRRVYMKKEAWR